MRLIIKTIGLVLFTVATGSKIQANQINLARTKLRYVKMQIHLYEKDHTGKCMAPKRRTAKCQFDTRGRDRPPDIMVGIRPLVGIPGQWRYETCPKNRYGCEVNFPVMADKKYLIQVLDKDTCRRGLKRCFMGSQDDLIAEYVIRPPKHNTSDAPLIISGSVPRPQIVRFQSSVPSSIHYCLFAMSTMIAHRGQEAVNDRYDIDKVNMARETLQFIAGYDNQRNHLQNIPRHVASSVKGRVEKVISRFAEDMAVLHGACAKVQSQTAPKEWKP